MDKDFPVCFGVVKWFDCAKGYGFINGSQDSDVMVHYKDIVMNGYRKLYEGDKVKYQPIYTDGKGWKAINVSQIDPKQSSERLTSQPASGPSDQTSNMVM